MVESLRELSRLCQKPRYKQVGNWMVRNILRDAALPITWLLLHTPVTANQVTFFSLCIGLAGIFLLALKPACFFLIGMLLLQFWYLLDHVDGQIARYRKTSSLTGRFFDFVMHHILHGVFFFGVGCYVYFLSGHFIAAIWGFVTAFCMVLFNLLQDTQYKTFFEKILMLPGIIVRSSETGEKEETSSHNLARVLFSFGHKAIEMHVLMNIFSLAAIFQCWVFKGLDFRLVLFVIYGVLVPVLTVLKTTYWILTKRVDAEFERNFIGENGGETS